jgi:glycosyltransferase involved in cell wall biosynthesis
LFYFEIVFLAAVSVQFIYLLVFLIAFARKQKPSPSPASETVPVSVVVCAHDEHENLRELIPQLLVQQYPDFEVIVVDDRSNDETRNWLLTETQKNARLRMVQVNHTPDHINGKKYALTLGIRAALHEWIVLTDADCRPASTLWLQSLSNHFSTDKQFVLGYSPYQKRQGWLNRFIRFETVITAMQYLGFALLKIPYMGVGRNMAYRKSLFMDTKGFTNMLSLTGGDDDLFVNKHARAGNTAVALGKDALMISIPKITVRDFYQQKIRHLAAGKKYKTGHRLLLGMFMISWLLTWLLGLPLLFPSGSLPLIGGLLAGRLMLFAITLYVTVKRMGESFEIWSLLVLDIIYPIYYLTTGTVALLTKKIRWKN